MLAGAFALDQDINSEYRYYYGKIFFLFIFMYLYFPFYMFALMRFEIYFQIIQFLPQ